MKKLRVGVLGATGMVGQRFISLFEVVVVAASPASAGKRYRQAVAKRWYMESPIPTRVGNLAVMAMENDFDRIVKEVDLVFSALDMDKEKIKQIEIRFAKAGIPVASNNSAHRWTVDVPMVMPEINQEHLKLIDVQRKNRGWTTGLIGVKPNCSIQSYVSILTALKRFEPTKVHVTSLQAISGAGKTFETWPEMADNLIPFIGGEELKSEREPMKIWGKMVDGKIKNARKPVIAATCIRVPATDGHMASVSVTFKRKPSRKQIVSAIESFNPLKNLRLPSSPKRFIKYLSDESRPQTRVDRNFEDGMGITMGRLREGKQFDWHFIALSHNTVRGAAGGAILMAELLYKKGYVESLAK